MSDQVPVSVDDARVILRLVYDTIDDLSADEHRALGALANACGYDAWRAERVAEGRRRHDEEMQATFVVLGLLMFSGHAL